MENLIYEFFREARESFEIAEAEQEVKRIEGWSDTLTMIVLWIALCIGIIGVVAIIGIDQSNLPLVEKSWTDIGGIK